MVKKIALVYGVALVLSSVLAVAVVVVSPTKSAKADSAMVIRDVGCTILDGNGALVFTPENQAVITSNGNVSDICRAQVTPSSTAQGAVHWNFANTGLPCMLIVSSSIVTSQHWEEVVTPSGQATATCHVHGSSS